MRAAGIGLAGLFGLIFGSFANVVIYRVPAGESIVKPASRCGSCGAPVASRDNVPVLSWLLLRGKCRACGARISPRYPIVELLGGALFALAAATVRRPTDLIAYLPLMWVLLVLSFIDLDTMKLPNKIVLPSIATGAVLFGVAAALGPGLEAWLRALLGSAAGFSFLFVLALISPKGMGMGDVKLAALLGMALGYLSWPRFFVGFFFSFALGAIGGLLLIASRRGGMKTLVPFGPYLALGTAAATFWGEPIARAWLHR